MAYGYMVTSENSGWGRLSRPVSVGVQIRVWDWEGGIVLLDLSVAFDTIDQMLSGPALGIGGR